MPDQVVEYKITVDDLDLVATGILLGLCLEFERCKAGSVIEFIVSQGTSPDEKILLKPPAPEMDDATVEITSSVLASLRRRIVTRMEFLNNGRNNQFRQLE